MINPKGSAGYVILHDSQKVISCTKQWVLSCVPALPGIMTQERSQDENSKCDICHFNYVHSKFTGPHNRPQNDLIHVDPHPHLAALSALRHSCSESGLSLSRKIFRTMANVNYLGQLSTTARLHLTIIYKKIHSIQISKFSSEINSIGTKYFSIQAIHIKNDCSLAFCTNLLRHPTKQEKFKFSLYNRN